MPSIIRQQKWLHRPALFLTLFLCTLSILHHVPLTVDDGFFRNLQLGTDREALSFVLNFGNGRVLGNGGIIFLLHHLLLSDVVRAGLLADIAMLLPGALKLKEPLFPILTLFLLLSISPGIFGEAYSWMSGFQNYVPPVFLLLCAVNILQAEHAGGKATKALRYTLLFLCGISMQLYIEHSSLLNCLTALLIMIECFRKRRNARTGSVILFSGTVIGFAVMCYVMLVIPDYVVGGKTSYFAGGLRTLISGVLRNAVSLMGMYSENAVVICFLTVPLLLQIIRIRERIPPFQFAAVLLGLTVPTAIFSRILISGLSPWYGKLAIAESGILIFATLWYVATVITCFWLLWHITESAEIKSAGILFVAAVICFLPTLFISPVGYRCLFHSTLMLIGADLQMIRATATKQPVAYNGKILAVSAAVLLLSLVICLASVFSDIRRMDSIREEYLQEVAASGAETSEYFLIPSPYLHDYWDDQYEHAMYVNGRRITLDILPADVWFRLCYYHTS